jgi:hypothetical protein
MTGGREAGTMTHTQPMVPLHGRRGSVRLTGGRS